MLVRMCEHAQAVALGGLAVAAIAVSSSSAASAQTAERKPEKVYATVCGYCHGHNVGPIIRGRNISPPVIAAMVRSGNGAMPAFKPTEISDAELAALARWIQASDKDPKEHGK